MTNKPESTFYFNHNYFSESRCQHTAARPSSQKRNIKIFMFMAKKKGFFQFWRERTAELLGMEKTIYLELIMHQAENRDLPTDEKRLASIAKIPYNEFVALYPPVKAKFTVEGNRMYDEELRQLTKKPAPRKVVAVKKIFDPPTEKEVIEYFLENGYSKESAIQAYKYYSEGNPPWTDSKGHEVRAWKQKMRAVWFKVENKIPENKFISLSMKEF